MIFVYYSKNNMEWRVYLTLPKDVEAYAIGKGITGRILTDLEINDIYKRFGWNFGAHQIKIVTPEQWDEYRELLRLSRVNAAWRVLTPYIISA